MHGRKLRLHTERGLSSKSCSWWLGHYGESFQMECEVSIAISRGMTKEKSEEGVFSLFVFYIRRNFHCVWITRTVTWMRKCPQSLQATQGWGAHGWNFNLEWTMASRRISTFREWKAQWHEARQNDFDLNLIQRHRPHRTTWLHNESLLTWFFFYVKVVANIECMIETWHYKSVFGILLLHK